MTQSANNDIDISISDDIITIKLDETYGATTSYLDNTNVVYSTDDNTDTITLDLSDITSDITIDGLVDTDMNTPFWHFENKPFVNTMPAIDEINRMCEIYPGLAKAYENFKTAYSLVEQDYEGKKKAGEIPDDDIPF